ncbi:MAG: long-chain fatty acid--CoA ligase [Acidobacteriota bacterium]
MPRQRPWLAHYDYWVPAAPAFPRRPLYEILRHAAADRPDHPACTFLLPTPGGTLASDLSFGDLKARVDRLATALAARGLVKGDRVGVMLPNCPQYALAVFAVLRLGAIVVNINPAYTPPEIAFILRDSAIRMLVTLDALVPAVSSVRHGMALETIVVTALTEYASVAKAPAPAEGVVRLADLLDEAPRPDLPRVPIDPDEDVAVLQYTGGTTGVPKAAMLTHRNIFANVIQTELWHKRGIERGEDRHLLVIPYFHIYGLTVGLMMGLWIGARQIQVPRYDVEVVLAAIRDYRPTYVPAVPTIYVSLLNHPRLHEYGLDRVKVFNSGSAPLPLDVLERFERQVNVPLNEGYGLSEASPVTHSTPHLARRKPGSIGLPLPGTDMKIVSLATGTDEVAPGENGELCIAGPQVMKGYWNRPDETAIALRAHADGRVWLHTGDVARMDEDGYTFIVQRKKDMLIVDGYNVYPSEVERALYLHPAVMEAAVVGVTDPYHGEIVKAVVVLRPGQAATPDELKAHCRGMLAEYKRPRVVEIRDSLPKSAVGKVLYTALRAGAVNGA